MHYFVQCTRLPKAASTHSPALHCLALIARRPSTTTHGIRTSTAHVSVFRRVTRAELGCTALHGHACSYKYRSALRVREAVRPASRFRSPAASIPRGKDVYYRKKADVRSTMTLPVPPGRYNARCRMPARGRLQRALDMPVPAAMQTHAAPVTVDRRASRTPALGPAVVVPVSRRLPYRRRTRSMDAADLRQAMLVTTAEFQQLRAKYRASLGKHSVLSTLTRKATMGGCCGCKYAAGGYGCGRGIDTS